MATASTTHISIPVLDLKAQYTSIREEIQAAINSVLENQHFILGPQVKELEQEVAKYCGCKYAVGVASGTDALLLGLKACGVGPGDEVIVPSFTFIATADCVSLLGATPVFAEIDRHTFNIDPDDVKTRITSRTKAIVPVHLYGQSADLDPLLDLARSYGVKVIEDCAQAIGATYRGRLVGSMGDVGCLSFFPSKNLGGYGDGGMILTDSEEIHRHLISLRAHGSTKKYFSEEQGWNSRLDELQAAVLRVKLRHLPSWTKHRRAAACRYDDLLRGVPGLSTPQRNGFGEHVFHQYTIRIRHRDQVQKRLTSIGISTMVYYPVPIHLQPIYAGLNYENGSFRITEETCLEVLSLPMFPELTPAQSECVAECLAEALQQEGIR